MASRAVRHARVRWNTGGVVLALCIALVVTAAAYAAAGALDTTFSSDGKVAANLSVRGDFASAVAVQTDGKIVVAGAAAYDTRDAKFALARFNANGTLDTTFAGDGRVVTNFTNREDGVYGLAIQPDGKIVAAGDAGLRTGNSRFAVARYNSNGTLDTTFGGDGKVTTNFTTGDDPVGAVVMQPTGEIIVAGGSAQNRSNPRMALARYLPDGSLDTTFSGDGKVALDVSSRKDYANAVILQEDGKIVVGGLGLVSGSRAAFEVVRLNADGTPDTTFSGDGMLLTNFSSWHDSVQGLVVLSDDDIVAGGIAASGSVNAKFALARYNPDGTLDATFGGGDGKVTTDVTGSYDAAWDIVVQPDDKVVAGGEASGGGGRFAIARYMPDGSPDLTFGNDGNMTVNFTSRYDAAFALGRQPLDGNLVLAGAAGWGFANPTFAVARILDE